MNPGSCSKEDYCKGVQKLIGDGKGIAFQQYMNIKTGENTRSLLVYKMDGKRYGKAYALNFCPVCGVNLRDIWESYCKEDK